MAREQQVVVEDLVLVEQGSRGEVSLYAVDHRFLVEVRSPDCTTVRTYDDWATAHAAFARSVERTLHPRVA